MFLNGKKKKKKANFPMCLLSFDTEFLYVCKCSILNYAPTTEMV